MGWESPAIPDTLAEVRVAEFYDREARRREFLAQWGRLLDWLDSQRGNPDLPAFAKHGGEGSAPGYTLRQIDAARATLDIMARAFTGAGDAIEDLEERQRRRVAAKTKERLRRGSAKSYAKKKADPEQVQRRRHIARISQGLATVEDYAALGREVPADFETLMKKNRARAREKTKAAYHRRQATSACACDDPACPHCRPSSSNGCSH